MKKSIVVKIILVIILVLFALFLINLIRNYIIINGIFKKNDEFLSSLDNYYYECTTTNQKGEKVNAKIELFMKNGVYVEKNYMNDKFKGTNWLDSKTGEMIVIDENGNKIEDDIYEGITTEYKNAFLKEHENVIRKLFSPIIVKDGCYVIESDNGWCNYIDTKTKIIKKAIVGDSILTFNIEKDIVTDDDVQKAK